MYGSPIVPAPLPFTNESQIAATVAGLEDDGEDEGEVFVDLKVWAPAGASAEKANAKLTATPMSRVHLFITFTV